MSLEKKCPHTKRMPIYNRWNIQRRKISHQCNMFYRFVLCDVIFITGRIALLRLFIFLYCLTRTVERSLVIFSFLHDSVSARFA